MSCSLFVQGQVKIDIGQSSLPDGLSLDPEHKSKEIALGHLDQLVQEGREMGYLTMGYEVTSEDETSEGSDLHINMHVGQQYSFENLTLDSNMIQFAKEIRLDQRDSNQQLQKLIQKTLNDLDSQGFPFAKIDVHRKHGLDNLIYTEIGLDKGNQITVDSVVVNSEVALNYASLMNQIGVSNGDLYNGERMKMIDARLKELPFLKLARPSELIFTEDEARLFVFLKEKKANRIDAIIGFQPNSEGEVVFTGDVDLLVVNAFKRAEQFGFKWSRVNDSSQDLELKLAYPYLFDSPFGIQSSFELYRQDSTFSQVSGIIGVDYSLDNGDVLTAFFNSKSYRSLLDVTGTDNDLGTSTSQYGLTVSRVRLDNPFTPRSGLQFLMTISAGEKKFSTTDAERQDVSADDGQQYEGAASARLFNPIGKRSTLLLGVQAKTISSKSLISKELHRIGGVKSLRGFDEQSISASSFGIGTLEYRFLIGSDSFISAFYDQGIYESNTESELLKDTPFGFGVGTSMATKTGYFSISYALGSQFGNGIDLRTGKVHFGYSAAF